MITNEVFGSVDMFEIALSFEPGKKAARWRTAAAGTLGGCG
jgi:hypothetical protein